RLGGNVRMGVFATRSPFRPNPLGLSCVALERVDWDAADGPALEVSGADLLDGTPIYDVKPYTPYADAFPDARAGFASAAPETVAVDFPPALLARVTPERRAALLGVLSLDPRPRYQDDPARVYGMRFGDYEVRFRVADGVLTVTDLQTS
nr:tRNA (N6-threonylcarbamoyladenosine(37)-N6)-methyltransferase TrmO [Oscillospiraceae bacterium]